MKRLFLVLALTFGLFGMAQAQVREPYAGVGLVLALPGFDLGSSRFSVQGGATAADNLEVRASADLSWFFTLLGVVSADAIYSFPVSDDFDLYLGAGPSLQYFVSTDLLTTTTELTFDANAVAGLEYAFDGVGVYGEFKVPISQAISNQGFYGFFRTGVNFYF